MDPLISTSRELAAFCGRAAGFPAVAVDTEFMRERTYWPVLCLVQVATPDEARAVDALAGGLDLAPLLGLLSDPGVVKVFHAARQDLEIFHRLAGRVPAPIFDTQVAAMACGYGESVGYERLVRDIAGGSVDKANQFTDWARRPLRRAQVAYALDDVTHLRAIHAELSARVEAGGREAWLADEMAVLADPATYLNDPDAAWTRIKHRSRKPLSGAVLRALAAWREREAQARDVPRGRVLGDRAISIISAAPPRSVRELRSLRGIEREQVSNAAAEEVVAIVGRVRASDPSTWPRPADPGPQGGGPVVELLKVLLKLKSEGHGVAPKLLATSADLAAIAEDDAADVPALRGWRRDVFGEDALRLKRGEAALVIRGSRPALVPAPPAPDGPEGGPEAGPEGGPEAGPEGGPPAARRGGRGPRARGGRSARGASGGRRG